MILRHSVTWITPTNTHDSEGMVAKTWSVLKTTKSDVQPKSLSENEAKLFGISSQQSGAKKIFIKIDSQIVEGIRAFFDGILYEVRCVNKWVKHCEVIAIPVIGETWTATYSVTYNGNGATSGTVPVDSGAYEAGDAVTLLDNTGGLALAGHEFIGWSLTA